MDRDMDEEQLVVVMENFGFITSKKAKDIKPDDSIMCKVKDATEAEMVIHGGSIKYTIEKDIDGIGIFRKL